jgi:hypothetical protein
MLWWNHDPGLEKAGVKAMKTQSACGWERFDWAGTDAAHHQQAL